MAARRSAAEWHALVSAWQRSELSAADFGRKHGVNGQRLAWWRWKLAAGSAAPALVPVEVTSLPFTTAATSSAVEIHVAGKVLVVQPDVDAAALRRLLALLEETV
jgi:hypothetical protein